MPATLGAATWARRRGVTRARRVAAARLFVACRPGAAGPDRAVARGRAAGSGAGRRSRRGRSRVGCPGGGRRARVSRPPFPPARPPARSRRRARRSAEREHARPPPAARDRHHPPRAPDPGRHDDAPGTWCADRRPRRSSQVDTSMLPGGERAAVHRERPRHDAADRPRPRRGLRGRCRGDDDDDEGDDGSMHRCDVTGAPARDRLVRVNRHSGVAELSR